MSLQRKSTQKGVPGLPLAALASIKDENVRQVLQALADGWALRNGNSGTGGARFVTLEELEGVRGKALSLEGLVNSINGSKTPGGGNIKLSSGEISAIIGDLEAQIMASRLWRELGERVTLLNINSSVNAAKIEEETVQRLNGDNAIVQQTMTQYAVINGNVAALQQQFSTTANNVAALSQALTTVQATVGQNVAAIQQETTARVTSDNDIYAKYSVKIDTNGYVSGFGLMSTANNGAPISDFIVRADRFAIGSPSGPGVTPRVPFIVLTTTDAKGNPPGVYMRDGFIANAAVDTLKIAGNSVTVPVGASGSGGIPGLTVNLPFGGSILVCVTANAIAAPGESSAATLNVSASCNGSSGPSVGVSMAGANPGITGSSGSATAIGKFDVGPGVHTVGGSAFISIGTRTIGACGIFALGVMR